MSKKTIPPPLHIHIKETEEGKREGMYSELCKKQDRRKKKACSLEIFIFRKKKKKKKEPYSTITSLSLPFTNQAPLQTLTHPANDPPT